MFHFDSVIPFNKCATRSRKSRRIQTANQFVRLPLKLRIARLSEQVSLCLKLCVAREYLARTTTPARSIRIEPS